MSEAYFQDGSAPMLALEAMVDKVGLRNVLYALSTICFEKADHVRHDWQDDPLATCWESHASRLNKFAAHTHGVGVA